SIGNNTTVELAGLTITGGNTAGGDGGGIYVYNGTTLTVTDCTIAGNVASIEGGGIFSHGTLTVTDCTIFGNTARNGGGIHSFNGTLTVTNSTISGNSATDVAGGIFSYGTLTVTDCTISGNSAYSGGGIWSYGTATVTSSTIAGNWADYFGGGMYSHDTLTVTDCTISGNSAYDGGGICSDSTLTVTNSTIAGNVALGRGGGIDNWVGTTTIRNSILAKNMSAAGVENVSTYNDDQTFTHIAYSLLDSTATPNGGKAFIDEGNNLLDVDPQFMAIPATIDASTTGANYDPANWNLRLQPGSPAIDKGNTALAVDAEGNPLTHDLDGKPRIIGNRVDIGAYEFQGSIVVTTFSDWSTGVPWIHDLSLREALLLAKAGDVITFDAALFNDDGTAKGDLVLQYGELVVKNSVQIIGNGVTIDASGVVNEEVNVSRIFNVSGNAQAGCEVELVGFTLTGGVTSTQGGALYAKNAQLTLTDVTFVGNTANYGGAVYFVDSTIIVMDCTMTGNHSKWGGAIYQNGGALTSSGSNVIIENTATWGGAIYQADGKLSLDDVTISGNDSTYGGGLYQAKGTATLTANTTISSNTASRSFGSAIVKAKDAVLTINNHDLDTALSLYLDEIERFL
ncbi:MAG: right-handed parallel beta-helix repeat-containing protein, partial [Planctomycetaceae bacterium]|nr:right-handed parallel beta-helix repeat-containing protein [Planctomycetaceae bacterium]